ncbi:MAG: hypothetical protein KF744_15990 [Taibaiella sp.]|nr:hypothetical protein [Taibaiella sp.]
MKRILPLLALIVFVSLASCRKRYSCACDRVDGLYLSPIHVEYYLGKRTKADAERECYAKQTAIYQYNYTCKLN